MHAIDSGCHLVHYLNKTTDFTGLELNYNSGTVGCAAEAAHASDIHVGHKYIG